MTAIRYRFETQKEQTLPAIDSKKRFHYRWFVDGSLVFLFLDTPSMFLAILFSLPKI